MGVYTAAVQQLYVAYFNRPADVAGQAYWEGVVAKANGSTAAVSAAFAASAEYKAAYAGLDAYHVVAQVYQNLFGHAPDLPGLNFWGQALIAGQMTVDNVVTEIAKGAQGTDLTAYNNKVAAATAFTVALDTPAEVLAYSGDAANAAAKTFISSVTDDASLAAAIAPAALNNTVSGIVDAGNVGKMFTLTQGQDIIVGTAGNDTINVTTFNPTTGATATNLSSIDSIDGGAGKDTLNLDLTGGTNSVSGVTIKNVEIINLTGAATTDASVFQGATNINFDATGTSVTKLAAGTTVAFNGTASDITVGAAGASASVALNNVIETAALNVGGSALSSVTVSGTRVDGADSGTSVSAQNLNVTVGKDVQALTLNTNQASVLTVAQTTGSTKAFTTINASASTGALTIDGTSNTSLSNITTGTGNDTVTLAALTSAATSSAAAVNATVTTGDGNDTVVVNSTGDGMTTVDAGAGNDKITVSATTGPVTVLGGAGNDTVTINKVLATSDVVNGGDGTDTISFAGAAARTADDYIVFNKLVTNFETLSFSSAETGLDASKLAATYTGIDLATGSIVTGVGTQAITAHGDVDLTAAGYKTGSSTTYAGTLGVSESADGAVVVKADVLNLTVKAAAANDVTSTLSGDVRTANVTLTNTVDSASHTTADRVAHFVLDNTSTDTALATLTLTGSGDANVTNAGGKLVTVDASGLNGTSAVAANNGAALHGLTYMSSNASAETIKLGAAVDTITLSNSTYGSMDVVTGLKLVANSDATDVTSASDVLHVTAIDGPAVKFTTTQTDIDLALKDAAASSKGDNLVFQLGGDTYVYHDAGTPAQIDAADTVVKITGAVDLDTLILSLAHTI
jgi:trimeric autotransporter adhesin